MWFRKIELYALYMILFLICSGKPNFLEKRIGEYQKASMIAGLGNVENQHVFWLDEDF